VGGLLELSRQYNSMPEGIKELSSQGLKDSIVNIIDKHGTLMKYKDYFPQKEIKELFLNLYLISKTKKEKYFDKLFEHLSNPNTNKGVLKATKYIIDKADEPDKWNIAKKDMFDLLNDLLFLLIEFLDYRGHTLSVIYRLCKQIDSTNDIYDYFLKHYEIIKNITFKETKDFESSNFKIIINCHEDYKKMYENYLNKILDLHNKVEKRIYYKNNEDSINYIRSREEDKILIIKSYTIYNLDENYMDKINKEIYAKIDDFIVRTFTRDTSVGIYKIKVGRAKLVDKPGKSKNIKLNIKYYNQYWQSDKFIAISDYRYEEINKINEWIKVVENSPRNQVSYNALWSILEFLLIDNVYDNKIDSIIKNFMPYLGLFYFRKSLKTFFKKLVRYHKDNQEVSQKELIAHIKNHVKDKYEAKYTNFADAFFLFTYDKSYKNSWWTGIEIENCTINYLTSETLKLHDKLHSPTQTLERFDSLVKNDLKQMYRLRNMSAHSGVFDNRMLINTFDRLKYYVETLLNAISYAWLEQLNGSEAVFDVNDLKRVDWEDYKSHCKSFSKDGEIGVLQLVNYKGLIKIPPNRFSFLS